MLVFMRYRASITRCVAECGYRAICCRMGYRTDGIKYPEIAMQMDSKPGAKDGIVGL